MPTVASGKSSLGSRPRLKAGRLAPALAVLAASTLAPLSCRTVEPPPPPEPAREEVISWEITPPKGYYANAGYVILEYTPPEALKGPEEIPPGGRLTIHLGYIDIRSANTLWYRFEVMEGAKRRLRLEGEDNIPNVKDPDQYWWNDLDIDLDEPITTEIRVIVTDKRINAAYPFILKKVITYR
ncbi:MAG: hypothetical protein H6Q29_1400 [Bacteroidetes bacterium]|nr:hypothetical protein [Bacteroidota bacterium]